MSSIKTIINSHPLAAYMILCFLLSWGSVIYCVGLDGFPARVLAGSREKLPLIVAATLSGPSISGLVLSLVKYGGKGTKQNLLDRYQWKRQYVLLALFAPSVVGLVLALMCSFVSSELYTPAILLIEKEERASFLFAGLSYGVAAGVFEELGWSFFLVPEMLQQREANILDTGISIGLVWGMWHFLVAVWGSGNADGTFSMDLFVPWIPWNLMVMPAYRDLMVHVFEATGGNAWAMTIMHGTLTACLPFILMPTRVTGLALASFYSLFAVTLGFIKLCICPLQGSNIQIRKV